MVDQNILKLELKRIRENLNDRSDDVLSQEKRRLQLGTVSTYGYICSFFFSFELQISLRIKNFKGYWITLF